MRRLRDLLPTAKGGSNGGAWLNAVSIFFITSGATRRFRTSAVCDGGDGGCGLDLVKLGLVSLSLGSGIGIGIEGYGSGH